MVSWFGTDLRAGNCQIVPGIENATTLTEPISWSVAGLSHANAYVVSQKDGRPAYGGTPSDQTVDCGHPRFDGARDQRDADTVHADGRAGGNTLPDPYGGSAQAVYPWRGRITCHPAAGPVWFSRQDGGGGGADRGVRRHGARRRILRLSGDTVVYSGPNEWSFRRMVLHQAYLAKAAGGGSMRS